MFNLQAKIHFKKVLKKDKIIIIKEEKVQVYLHALENIS